MTVVGRLAPSPTGAQHVGNARTYLLAWLSVRSRGGRLILRIEDLDSPRTKPGAEQQAIDDLRWLGLDWDEGPDVGGPHVPYRQTERTSRYGQLFADLRRQELVYPCGCSRADVQAAASAPHWGQEGPVYPGTCAGRRAQETEPDQPGLSWRLRTRDRMVTIDDAFAGAQQANVAGELGDFVVFRADGTFAYQLAVVADDHDMGVTEVLRGDDLLPSAFRQLELYQRFGWEPPRFVHVPLVVGPDGRRLAKRHGDTRLATIRESGISAARLVGLLAHASGLRPDERPVTPAELLDDFDLARIPRAAWVFDQAELESLR